MSARRELDALQLLVGTLRPRDTAVELGACEHSITRRENLAAGVRVCVREAELAQLESLAWLRLASWGELSPAVQVAAQAAVLQHRPRIMLDAESIVATDEVLAWLEEQRYCALARVGAYLFLAPRSDCPQPASKSSGKEGPIRAALGSAREILHTGKQIAFAPVVDGRRDIAAAIKLYRAPTARTRKLMKLATDPQRFLEDARSPWLHGLAAQALATLPGWNRPTRATTCYDFPKRSVLVFCTEDPSASALAWSRLLEDPGLATEIVVVANAALHDSFAALLADAACPRLRVYLIDGPTAGQRLLDYGIARCYASNIAIVSGVRAASLDAIAGAFTQLSDNRPYVVDLDGIVAAKRDRLRDHNSGEHESAVLAAALAGLAGTIPSGPEGPPSTLADSPNVFAYPTLSPERSFSPDAHPRVLCLEKRPAWSLPISAAAWAQRPRVSIIMTVYNAAATVQQAAMSVLRQSYRNLELILIDDVSDDGSLDILLALARADSRVRVLQTANNSGTYFAKNVGLSFATGDYVSFHDSDDISAGNRLQLQVEALDCDPLAIANYTRYQRISEDGREVWFGGKTNRPGYITLLFRREQVLEAVGFFDSVRISADAELVDRLRLTTRRPVRLLPFVTYYALQAEGSLTTSGAGAFSAASDGKVSMPPVRQRYREAADAWHRECHLGSRSARMPFPLGRRPFEAPEVILPDRGYSALAERLVELTRGSEQAVVVRELSGELQRFGAAKLETKSMEAIQRLGQLKRVKDCRKLFLATVDAMEQDEVQSGLAFADRNLRVIADIPSAAAVARSYADQGSIERALAIFHEHVPEERRGPLYARLAIHAALAREGVPTADQLILPAQEPRPRHVLYHADQSLPFHSSGYALRTQYLLSALRDQGWQSVCATRFGYPSDRRDANPEWELVDTTVIDGVPYVYTPDPQGLRGLTASEQHGPLVQSLVTAALAQRPAVLHSASNHVVGLAGARVARALGIPSVYELRGLWHMTRSARQPVYQDSDHYQMVERLELQAAHESDFVLTLTSAMRDLLIGGGVPPDKIAVLPNAVDTDRFVSTAAQTELVHRQGLDGTIGIGFIGSMSDYEGLDLLLEAVAMLGERNDFHVLLVGDGPARAELEALSRVLGLQDRVSFTGRVAHEEVRSYYALVDILVYPRKALRVCEYVSPLKPFEALAQEKAVVVSSVGALAESVEHEQSGLVFEKGSAAALAAALQRLLDDRQLRARLGKRGREWVIERHTWQEVARQLQDVYERLLCSPAR